MYLTGVSNPAVIALHRPDIGLMIQPGNSYHLQIDRYPAFAGDCGAYGGRFNETRWLTMLDAAAVHQEKCLFIVCPDRFDPDDVENNHRLTVEQWHRYKHQIWDRGLPAAFVAQNGCTPDDVPADTDAVFIGGDTHYKLSEVAWAVIATAKAHGKWAHVGRVNSMQRIRACSLSQADSADGTYLKHGPDVNLPNLTGWLDQLNYQPHLAMFGGAA
jgi:hypothetical protein